MAPSSESVISSADEAASLQAVREALRGLQFGSVTVVVQDGVVVQVERIEKKRLVRPASPASR